MSFFFLCVKSKVHKYDQKPSNIHLQITRRLHFILASFILSCFECEIKRTLKHGLGRVCHSCLWRLSCGIGPTQHSVWVEDLGGFFWAVSPSLFCIQEQSPSALETVLMVPTWMWLRAWCTGDVLNFRPMKAGECWFLSWGLWTGMLCFVLFSYDKFAVFHCLSVSHKWCSGALCLFYTSLLSLCFDTQNVNERLYLPIGNKEILITSIIVINASRQTRQLVWDRFLIG